MSAAVLDAVSIRRSEDAFVDDLIAAAPDHGAALIVANFARAYIDLNRQPFELDASMFADELPAHARGRTARVAAGLGTIARVVSEGQEIYHRKLMFAEAETRIAGAHRPYHEALVGLIAEAKAAHGFAILVDWHSMPSAAARSGTRDKASDIDRALYLDEATVTPTSGFARLKGHIEALTGSLAAADWSGLKG